MLNIAAFVLAVTGLTAAGLTYAEAFGADGTIQTIGYLAAVAFGVAAFVTADYANAKFADFAGKITKIIKVESPRVDPATLAAGSSNGEPPMYTSPLPMVEIWLDTDTTTLEIRPKDLDGFWDVWQLEIGDTISGRKRYLPLTGWIYGWQVIQLDVT